MVSACKYGQFGTDDQERLLQDNSPSVGKILFEPIALSYSPFKKKLYKFFVAALSRACKVQH